jgi:hypothetical protein
MGRKKTYRIGIVGSAGVGKSSLGLELSQKLDIPFLSSKEITMGLLNGDGYNYLSGIQVERCLAQGGRQDKIFKLTVDAEKKEKSFVADRTVIDLMAYVIAEIYYSDPQKVTKCFEKYQKEASKYTHLFFCSWGKLPLVDNKIRTLNPWYQFIIHSLELQILNTWDLKYHVLKSADTDERLAEISKALGI